MAKEGTHSATEVLPTAPFEGTAPATDVPEHDPASSCNPADLSQGNSRKVRRQPFPSLYCEKQFVILASVQGEFQSNFLSWLADPSAWNPRSVNLCAHTAFLANVRQICREPIADIDHGRRHSVPEQIVAQFDARLRIKMLGTPAWIRSRALPGPQSRNRGRRPT